MTDPNPTPTPEPTPKPDPTPTPDPKPTPPPDPLAGLSEEQQKELDRRIAAARKGGETDGERKAREALEAREAKAKDERERDEAAKRGEFDKVRGDLESKLTTAEQDAKTLRERVEAFEARQKAQMDAGLPDLPDDLKAFDPGADAAIDARWAWFEKARDIAATRTTDPVKGNGRGPDPAQTTADLDKAASEEMASLVWGR